jgi:hypothetical protein
LTKKSAGRTPFDRNLISSNGHVTTQRKKP